MRSWVLAVACVILVTDLMVVTLHESSSPASPTIEANGLAQDADDARGSSSAPGSSPSPRASPEETASPAVEPEQTVLSQAAQAPAAPSDRTAASTPEASTGPTAAEATEPSPSETDSPVPVPSSSSTPAEPDHGEIRADDGGEVTVQIVLPKTRFALGETVPFTLRMCNQTPQDIMWGYPEHQDRPVQFGFIRNSDDPSWAQLRNGDQGHTNQGAVAYLRLPADDCVSWSGRWEQTLGPFDLDGTGAGQQFPPGQLDATLTADGGVDGRNVRHPEYSTTLHIG